MIWCVACMKENTATAVKAVTIYHGHALCHFHLKQAFSTKERKIW